MTDENAHMLSNSFLAVRLIALHERPDSEGLGAGPYLVIQRAIDTEDPDLAPADFVLTRRGSWVPVALAGHLPPGSREALVCFPDAAAVINLLEQLQPDATLERPAGTEGLDGEGVQPEPEDPIDVAVMRVLSGELTDKGHPLAGNRRPSDLD